MPKKQDYIDEFLDWVQERNAGQEEYLQAVREIVHDISDAATVEQIHTEKLFHRMAEPDRIISFRVAWEDDKHNVQVNRGWRVQHSNAIGPYKGGLRFHPTVNESVLKFLAFEQMFKNALTGLHIGGGKGGSDFDPRGRSDREIMRFCVAFMNELYRYIGDDVDVPAGDINVGAREIGFLFGQYRRLANNFSGALTGKDLEFGGSPVRTEATGFGLVYFLEQMLSYQGDKIEGKRVTVSGAGNVALHAALKVAEHGGEVISLSNSKGSLYVKGGISGADLRKMIDANSDSMQAMKAIASAEGGSFREGKSPWDLKCDIALPCATQNELDGKDAERLIRNGCRYVAEGANMPTTESAIEVFEKAAVLHAPGKASNAGGVALSTLEMGQNAGFKPMEFTVLDNELRDIMRGIHRQCVKHGEDGDFVNYRLGANRAAFKRLSRAFLNQGVN